MTSVLLNAVFVGYCAILIWFSEHRLLLFGVAATSAIAMLVTEVIVFSLLKGRIADIYEQEFVLYTAIIEEVLRVVALGAACWLMAAKRQEEPYAIAIAVRNILNLAFFGFCIGFIEYGLRIIGYQGVEHYEFCATSEFPFLCQNVVMLAPISMHIALSAIYFPAMMPKRPAYNRAIIFAFALPVAVLFHFVFNQGSILNANDSAESLVVFSHYQLGAFMLWPIFGVLAVIGWDLIFRAKH